jgi:hypothetical protein
MTRNEDDDANCQKINGLPKREYYKRYYQNSKKKRGTKGVNLPYCSVCKKSFFTLLQYRTHKIECLKNNYKK